MSDRPIKETLRKFAEDRDKAFGRQLTSIWPLGLESMANSQARAESLSAMEDAVRGFIAEAVDLTSHSPHITQASGLVDDEVASLLSKLEERLVEFERRTTYGLAPSQALRSEFQEMRARITARMATSILDQRSVPRPATNKGGRPGKWNWEGALIHLVALANKPDGLPDGAGAQARIADLISDWFAVSNDDGATPADSEIKNRAKLIMEQLSR